MAAYSSPPQGYELSIYQSTPILFWVGAGAALLISLLVAFSTRSRGVRTLAFFLGGATMVLITALPILRGYYFFGAGDSMTHLGWTKELANGSISMVTLLYPGVHTISVFLTDVTGLSLRRTLMLTVPIFVAVFITFVPLVVRAITNDDRATLIAVYAAFLLLPVTHIGVNMIAHPTSQTIMYFPAVLFLAIMFVTGRDTNGDLLSIVSPAGLLLGLLSVAIVLLHPQQAANVLLVYGSITFVQLIYRLFRSDHPISNHRFMLVQTAFLAIVFAVWAPRHPEMSEGLGAVIGSLLSGAPPADAVGQRALSLETVGSSIWILFVKMFLVGALFSLLAGILSFGSIFHRLDERLAHENSVLLYLSVALVPVVGIFVLYVAAGVSTQYFRHYGFIMVLVTILGAVAIHRGLGTLSPRVSGRTLKVGGAIALLLVLAVSMPMVFRSPYIIQPSHQVTQSEMSGYEMAFDHRVDGIYYTGIRGSGERFGDAILGSEASKGVWFAQYSRFNYRTVPQGEDFDAAKFPEEYKYDHYIPITDGERTVETELYEGIRYPQSGFDSLDSNARVNLVQDSGEFQLYLFDHPNNDT